VSSRTIRRKLTGRQWWMVSIVWFAPATLAVVERVGLRILHGDPIGGWANLIWSGGDWLVYAIMTPAVFAIARRWPIERPHLARRVILHLGAALVFCAGWATSGKVLELLLGIRKSIDPSDLAGWILDTLPFGVVVYLSITAMAHSIWYFAESNDRDVQLAKLGEQLSTAKFAALQAQVNPHFLFNTLNTIAVLVRDDNRTGAVHIVEQLSELLRHTLSRHRANEVRLDDELDLARQYLEIERARFPDRLRAIFDIDPAVLAAAVPSFAVQHLIENAVRHGVARSTQTGDVRIAAARDGDALVVSVSDDGPGVDMTAASVKGHGLDNTRERLRALYGENAALTVARRDTGGTISTLRIPYRELPPEVGDAS
jgi:two-component system LytT family sensor kinase